jgi:hypothetical protein
MLCLGYALQGYFTPLMWASKHGHTAVVQALIGAGARLNVGSMVSYGDAVGELRVLLLSYSNKLFSIVAVWFMTIVTRCVCWRAL